MIALEIVNTKEISTLLNSHLLNKSAKKFEIFIYGDYNKESERILHTRLGKGKILSFLRGHKQDIEAYDYPDIQWLDYSVRVKYRKQRGTNFSIYSAKIDIDSSLFEELLQEGYKSIYNKYGIWT